jgi:hypothetical protein
MEWVTMFKIRIRISHTNLGLEDTVKLVVDWDITFVDNNAKTEDFTDGARVVKSGRENDFWRRRWWRCERDRKVKLGFGKFGSDFSWMSLKEEQWNKKRLRKKWAKSKFWEKEPRKIEGVLNPRYINGAFFQKSIFHTIYGRGTRTVSLTLEINDICLIQGWEQFSKKMNEIFYYKSKLQIDQSLVGDWNHLMTRLTPETY